MHKIYDSDDYNSRNFLQQLIISGEFIPYFQPIVSLENERIVGFEILARRILPDGVVIGPDDFISTLEHHNLLNELMSSLLHQSFMATTDWPSQLFLSVNVSPSQLNGKSIPAIIKDAAENCKFSLTRLKIEITETALIDEIDTARAELEHLSEMGCKIAMDDFGTGCSSLAWLIHLPASTLKIDRSFICSMIHKKYSRKIISSIIGLGRSLDMEVIAEGVETQEQAELLRSMGCEYAQGFFFGRAMPAKDTCNFLAEIPAPKFHGRLTRMSLEQCAHQISSMYSAPGVCICFLNPELIIVDASDTFAERMGWASDEVIQRNIFEVIPTESDRLNWLQGFREKGLPYPPYEVRLPGGKVDLVILTRVEDETKDLLGFCLFGVDISGRVGTDIKQ